MQYITQIAVEKSLQNCLLPLLNQDVISGGWLQDILIDKGTVHLQLSFGFPVARIQILVQQAVQQAVGQLPGVEHVTVNIHSKIRSHAIQPGATALPEIKNVIAVASGKGGVGKSTTAVNLALALQQEGAQVGLLDADIYGPNQPHMLGATGRPQVTEHKKILPLMAHGLQTMSIGYLVDAATPMVWRGPMISAALQQLVRDTLWSQLDYLLIDLPPGTGDIQLTLAKKVPVTGAIMVTTPQAVALLDVSKALEMFRKVDVKILGLIENMSYYECTHCNHRDPLFGENGGQRLAEQYQVPLLGRLPLASEIQQAVDSGCPTMVRAPDSILANNYRQIALQLAAKLAQQKINYAVNFPKVVVEE